MAKNCGENLCFEQDVVTIQKKIQKLKLATLKTRKGDLGKRERSGGLKTWKGRSRQKLGE